MHEEHQVAANGGTEVPKVNEETLEAYGEWVVVERAMPPEKTKDGVIIPDTVRDRMQPDWIGIVTSIGPDVNKADSRLNEVLELKELLDLQGRLGRNTPGEINTRTDYLLKRIAAPHVDGIKLGDRIVYDHCFPINKRSSREVVAAVIHKRNILTKVHSDELVPGITPKSAPFRQGTP